LIVEDRGAVLTIEPFFTGSNLVVPGESKKLFGLRIMNQKIGNGVTIDIDHMTLDFTDQHENPINAATVVDLIQTAFQENGVPVTSTTTLGNRLRFNFNGFSISSDSTRIIELSAHFVGSMPSIFGLRLERRDILATYADGPNVGRPVDVVSSTGDAPIVSRLFQTRSGGFRESFVIQNNPYHPDDGPAVFVYDLNMPSAITFQIFTITGEGVYNKKLDKGGVGTQVGENQIEWDGRNDEGDLVLSGVYIAIIDAIEIGQQARMKVAVIR
jgi:hypothetical protein